MIHKKYYFNFGRSALKYGLLSYKIDFKKKILIPDFICNEVTNALKEIKVPYSFYSVNDNLQPDWDQLNEINSENYSSIIMIHYFGKPQDINMFKKYSKEKNLFLIEDNAHGFGGEYNLKEMGTFGDFGISSPRKIINSKYGGILYINKRMENKVPLKKLPIANFIAYIHFIKNKHIKFLKLIKKFFLKRPLYENPYAFKEKDYRIFELDSFTKKLIKENDLNKIKKTRIQIYNYWKLFSIKKNFKQVFKSLNDGATHWCFPVYVNSAQERLELLDWGWKNQLNIFTWPSLPQEIIKQNASGYQRWSKLVCLSTDPSNLHIKKFL